jgi:predicted RNA-binding Zn ribbon-like protein
MVEAVGAPTEPRETSRVEPRLCLEFTNTVDWRGADGQGQRREEALTSYRDLVGWALRQEVLKGSEARRLLRRARREPEAAAAALERAIAVREAIYRIFSATAHGRAPDAGDLATMNGALAEALAHLRLVRTSEGFGWGWLGDRGREMALDRVLWPVVRAAAELFTSKELDRVKECANDPCGWLFLDVSRNRSRRWCSMESCGNRMKARRHYQRRRAEATGQASRLV